MKFRMPDPRTAADHPAFQLHLSARAVELILRGVRVHKPEERFTSGSGHNVRFNKFGALVLPPSKWWSPDQYFSKMGVAFCGCREAHRFVTSQVIRAIFDRKQTAYVNGVTVPVSLPSCPVCATALDQLVADKGHLFVPEASAATR